MSPMRRCQFLFSQCYACGVPATILYSSLMLLFLFLQIHKTDHAPSSSRPPFRSSKVIPVNSYMEVVGAIPLAPDLVVIVSSASSLMLLQVSHGKVTSDNSHASCSEDESESSFSATSASAYNTSRLLSMMQSIRNQQLQVVPLLNEISQQQRDSDLALKSVLSELQLLKSKAMPQQSQDTNL